MDKVYVFCDEYGTSTLKQNDVKNITKFVYCSVIIKESSLEKAKEVRNYISQELLFNKKIKSSSKALQNIERRLNCLKKLYSDLNFVTHFLIVDKEKLQQDQGGFRFKEVFIKYFQKILFAEINNKYDDFEIYMHHTISRDFGLELKDYLTRNINSSLFKNYNFSSDDDEPLIQFSDLIAGSFGKCFNSEFPADVRNEIFDVIKPNIVDVIFFPPENKTKIKKSISVKNIDEDIYAITRKDAIEKLEKEQDNLKKALLEQFLWHQKVAPSKYIQTFEIINYLKYHFNKDISTEAIRFLIRDLRFDGVLIVSANHKSGYKLAVNSLDIYEYFNHYSKYILPMLKKIQIANDIFTHKTVGEFKPIENFDDLNLLLSALNNLKIPNSN
jgi:hypothetical protein